MYDFEEIILIDIKTISKEKYSELIKLSINYGGNNIEK